MFDLFFRGFTIADVLLNSHQSRSSFFFDICGYIVFNEISRSIFFVRILKDPIRSNCISFTKSHNSSNSSSVSPGSQPKKCGAYGYVGYFFLASLMSWVCSSLVVCLFMRANTVSAACCRVCQDNYKFWAAWPSRQRLP